MLFIIYGRPPLDSKNHLPISIMNRLREYDDIGDFINSKMYETVCINDAIMLDAFFKRIIIESREGKFLLLTESEYGLSESLTMKTLIELSSLIDNNSLSCNGLYISEHLESSGIHNNELLKKLSIKGVMLVQYKGIENPFDISKSLLDFEEKIVKRIGLYNRGFDTKNDCNIYDRYYYDAKNCTDELIDILKWYLNNKMQSNIKKLLILYDGSISDWLKNIRSFSTFNENFIVGVEDINEIIENNLSNILSKFDYFLCLYPVKNTGSTLNNHIRQLTRINNKFNIESNVRFLSFLIARSTPFNPNEDRKLRTTETRIVNSKTPIQLDYFFEVDKGLYTIDECKNLDTILNKENVTCDDLSFHQLFSFEYWYFVNKYGLKPETEIPKHRCNHDHKNFYHIPSFKDIFSEYSQYFSEKIVERLRYSQNDSLFEYTNCVIITPDEKDINFITNSLQKVSKFDLIKVPRESIDNEDTNFLRHELQDILGANFIILDCFTRTGSTINKILRILENIGLTAIEKFAIFSYLSPDTNHDIISLYDIPIIYSDYEN